MTTAAGQIKDRVFDFNNAKKSMLRNFMWFLQFAKKTWDLDMKHAYMFKMT